MAGAGLSRMYTIMAGSNRSRFKAHGEDEYMVVANSVAPQLSVKSTKKAGNVYGVNRRMRDCKTDHSNMLNLAVQSVGAHDLNYGSVYGTGIASETLLTSATELPVCPDTQASFSSLYVLAMMASERGHEMVVLLQEYMCFKNVGHSLSRRTVASPERWSKLPSPPRTICLLVFHVSVHARMSASLHTFYIHMVLAN